MDAVISLTPAADGTVGAKIEFAGGAYTMVGTRGEEGEEAMTRHSKGWPNVNRLRSQSRTMNSRKPHG